MDLKPPFDRITIEPGKMGGQALHPWDADQPPALPIRYGTVARLPAPEASGAGVN
jgi:hypothetical protein